MPKHSRELWLWLPPVAMMALIFWISAMPADNEDHGFPYVLTRKAAHFTEYALLLALWWRALATKVSRGKALALGLGITVAFAISDELHQTFVAGRAGRPLDVVIDTAGALAASALIASARLRRRTVA